MTNPPTLLLVALALALSIPPGIFFMARRLKRSRTSSSELEHIAIGWRPTSNRIVLRNIPIRQGSGIWKEGDNEWDCLIEPGFNLTVVDERSKPTLVRQGFVVDLDRKVVINYEHLPEEVRKKLEADSKGTIPATRTIVPNVRFLGSTINEDDEVEFLAQDGSKKKVRGIWRMVNGQFLRDIYLRRDWETLQNWLVPWYAKLAKWLPLLLIPVTALVIGLFFKK